MTSSLPDNVAPPAKSPTAASDENTAENNLLINSMPELQSHHKGSFFDNVTSYLGSRNPFGRPYNPKTDEVWLLDNTAYRDHIYPHHWVAEYVAAYFIRDSGVDLGDVVADIACKLGIAKGDKAEDTISERLMPFVDSILTSRKVVLQVGNKGDGQHVALSPAGRNGISSDVRKVPGKWKDGDSVVSVPAANPEIEDSGRMTTYFAEQEGWLVISDIDDTIKITMTTSYLGILKSTFVDDPTPIAGMPALYAKLHRTLPSPPAWFYLSASPYNLYTFLQPFIKAHYPPGTIVLRDASWMNMAGFLSSLTVGTQAYKVSRMRKMHAWLPNRRVVAVGDSTQSDPEAYGDICRAYPGWVRRVFIRRVLNIADKDNDAKVADARFEKAFRGVDRAVWTVFEDPAELEAAVEELGRAKE